MHTPAPWTVTGRNITHGKWIVADVFCNPDATDEQRAANARLIAACPDLVEALRDCLSQMLTGHKVAATDPETAWKWIHKAENTARAALTKALGE